MQSILAPFLMQLAAQSPILLAYLIGLILALVFWPRCPTASLLVLIACVLLLVLAVTQPFVTQYLIQARSEMGWPHERLGWMFSAVALISSCLRAVAFSLLLAAAFVQRKDS